MTVCPDKINNIINAYNNYLNIYEYSYFLFVLVKTSLTNLYKRYGLLIHNSSFHQYISDKTNFNKIKIS